MKVTGEQSTVLIFFGFSRNISGQKMLVYHILILIHRGAKLYSQRRAILKILNSAPGLWYFNVQWCHELVDLFCLFISEQVWLLQCIMTIILVETGKHIKHIWLNIRLIIQFVKKVQFAIHLWLDLPYVYEKRKHWITQRKTSSLFCY